MISQPNMVIVFSEDTWARVATVTGAGDQIFSAGSDLKAATLEGLHGESDYGPRGFAGLDYLLNINNAAACLAGREEAPAV